MPLTILFVDDERIEQEKAKFFLEGKDVIFVDSCEEALEIIAQKHHNIGIVITDIYMEEDKMSGIDLLQKIKNNWPRMKVVVVSSTQDVHLLVESFDKLADDFLVKPLDMNEINEVVDRLMADVKRWRERLGKFYKIARSPE